jgi:FkbM family methyltransferase
VRWVISNIATQTTTRIEVDLQMIPKLIGTMLVRLFGLLARIGLHRAPVFERVFPPLYAGYKRYFEAGPIDGLQEFVPSGSLVIDVGANIGFFSLRFAKWVGDGGKVISVEPEDRNYNDLVSALQRKGLISRVDALKAAAAAVPGMMFLEINPLHPADHKLSPDGSGVAVRAVVLDDLVRDKSDLKLSLIKIDVQGAEMLVLEGASSILKGAGPALFVELHEMGLRRSGSSVAAILAYLSNYGYEGYWLMRTGPHRKASPAEIHRKVARSEYVDVLFLRDA